MDQKMNTDKKIDGLVERMKTIRNLEVQLQYEQGRLTEDLQKVLTERYGLKENENFSLPEVLKLEKDLHAKSPIIVP